MKNDWKETFDSPPPVLNGRVLFVDLHKQEWEEKTIPRDAFEEYLYGRGLSAYLLSSFCSTNAKQSKPLIFAPGLFAGVIPFSRSCISFVEDKEGIAVYSSSCQWGLELKMAGFDCLVIIGNSTTPVILNINNSIIKFDEPSGLWDQGTDNDISLFKNDQGDKWVDVYVTMGPNVPSHSLTSRSSYSPLEYLTQLFALKKLLAISVRGAQGFKIFNPEALKIELTKVLPLFRRSKASYECSKNGLDLGFLDLNQNLQQDSNCTRTPMSRENFLIIEDCLGLSQKIDVEILLNLIKSITGLNYSCNQLNQIAERIKIVEAPK
jgi:aldehyde:ferredoxin oxidoreductase